MTDHDLFKLGCSEVVLDGVRDCAGNLAIGGVAYPEWPATLTIAGVTFEFSEETYLAESEVIEKSVAVCGHYLPTEN